MPAAHKEAQPAEDCVDPTLGPLIERVLITTDSLRFRVQSLASEIAAHYKKITKPNQLVVLICILKGSYIFTADLARALHQAGCTNVVEFMCISSYSGSESTGRIRTLMDMRRDVAGHHCLIVEDIVDSGRTLEHLRANIESRAPASTAIVALLNKPTRRLPTCSVHVEWIGFDIPDVFVVGYGLDCDEFGRDVPFVAVARPALLARETARTKIQSPASPAAAAALHASDKSTQGSQSPKSTVARL